MSGNLENATPASGNSRIRTRSQNPGGFYSGLGGKQNVGIPEENLQLVPCRWSHTGWKYVQADPERTNFFSNPNRVNSFGFSASKKNQGRRMNSSVNAGGFTPQESEFQTSYTRFFNSSK